MFLEVKNLNVTLDDTPVVENISFHVNKGDVLTILGPNGAGKSVLIKAVLGLLPHTGEIKWHSKPKIAYLPQGLTTTKVKGMPFTVHNLFILKKNPATRSEIKDILHMVGLDDNILTKVMSTLSGGQFQRVLIAWVLISRPNIIFLDEPTTGIDIGGGETIYSLLNTIRKNGDLTIILVTHDLNIVYEHSTNVLCLGNDGYTCHGTPQEILNNDTLENLFGTKLKYHTHS